MHSLYSVLNKIFELALILRDRSQAMYMESMYMVLETTLVSQIECCITLGGERGNSTVVSISVYQAADPGSRPP